MIKLINCEDRQRQCPRTFEIPSPLYRHNCKVGDIVKLIWEDDTIRVGDNGERMWVVITELPKDKYRYIGKLDSWPSLFKGWMNIGDSVEFGPEHICEISTFHGKGFE